MKPHVVQYQARLSEERRVKLSRSLLSQCSFKVLWNLLLMKIPKEEW